MLTLKINKTIYNRGSIKNVNKIRNQCVVRASKSPQEIRDMIRVELAKANDLCCDINRSDMDCMLQWDIVDDLSFAYRRAVQEEKRKQHESEEETDRNYLWDTRKKTFDL